jgi:serine/threonine-protein kinase/endoribonuclease IRE1
VQPIAETITAEEPPQPPTKIREDEPAQEIIFPHEETTTPPEAPKVRFAVEEDSVKEAIPETIPEDEVLPLEKVDTVETTPETEDAKEKEDPEQPKTPKKKATRGKRAGRKQKEKEQAMIEARAKKNGTEVVPVTPPAEIISVAASESPQVSGPLQINSLVINTDKVIGQGSCGTIVFEGSFEGRDVAVKRMLSQYYELASQEVSFLQQSDDHPNVVRYFCQQKDDHFLYIAVELCQASLFEVWEADKAKTEERHVQMSTLKLAIQQDMTRTLHQLAAGLCHLHNLRIIHRDIKPQNILVAYPKRTQPNGTRLVISDFGLGKNLPENVSTLVDPTGNAGTSGWKAPELISQPRENEGRHSHNTPVNSDSGIHPGGGVSGVKRAADIFSLGCLFFWVLTDGVHPFEDENGWQQLRELNIKRDKKNMEALNRWSDAYEPMQLITSMLEHQPENRPTAQAVLNHPYFWPPEKRLAFLCDVSDHFEREPRGVYDDDYAGDSDVLCALEDRLEEVIGAPYPRADFLSRLDRQFVDTLGKQRKYSGNRLLDLLRALRNKKNHYEDMPENVKKFVGPLAGGYLGYWMKKFPRLLMSCYEVVHECGLQGNDRFKGYFGLGKDL